MMNFNLWFQIVELRDIWKESIIQLKKLNESKSTLNDELQHWNSAFNSLFNTSNINWVNLAMSAGNASMYGRNTEAFATVLGETLTDVYMCMSQGTNPVTRSGEKNVLRVGNNIKIVKSSSAPAGTVGIIKKIKRINDVENIEVSTENGENFNLTSPPDVYENISGSCKATRDAFVKILEKSEEDKTRWFTTVIAQNLTRRSEAYMQRSKVLRGRRKGIEYDTFIKTGTRNEIDDEVPGRPKATTGTVVGSGNILDTDDEDELRTLGDAGGVATTLMNRIKEIIRSTANRPDDQKPNQALRILDMISGAELSSLNIPDVRTKLNLANGPAERVVKLIRTATDQARKDLGLAGMRYKREKRPGAGRRI